MKEAKEKFYENPRMKIQEKERNFEKQLEDNILKKYNDIKRQIELRNLKTKIFNFISVLVDLFINKRTLSIASVLFMVDAIMRIMRHLRR